jgi:hypothetical protein
MTSHDMEQSGLEQSGLEQSGSEQADWELSGSEQTDLERTGAVPRPESVVLYERLAWAAIAVSLASAAATPPKPPVADLRLGATFVAGQLLWIWLVARRRQNWARWISLLVILLGIAGIAVTISDIERRFQINAVSTVLYYASFALSLISVTLLFRGDARDWFSRKAIAPKD